MNRQVTAKRMLKHTLRNLQESEMVSSFEEGEMFVCRYCETPEKPCLDNPFAECPEKILGGTDLQAIRERSRILTRDEAIPCLVCGRPLSAGALTEDPRRELCPTCRGRVRKVKRSTQ